MARPRSFDEATVLAGAMHAFRRTGFAAATIKELEQATGLAASSLYNSFGDKSGLFDAAFDHYLGSVLQRRIATHADPALGLAGVRKLFLTLLAEPRGERHGCLITNTAVEFGAIDEQRQRAVARGFEILRAALHDRLAQAAAAGLLAPAVDPAVAAVKLVALYQGVLVLVRSAFDRRQLERAIQLEFDSLDRR
jgi:AcrR family transcriptional regulator